MTKIKICGLMRLEDVSYVNACLPEYVGFVFAHSRRQVDGDWVRGLRDFLHPDIQTTGVFVNEDIDKIADLCNNGTIDVVQLHGDENREYIDILREYTDKPIIKAARVRTAEDIEKCEELPSDYLLLDTYDPNGYGGSGRTFDLSVLPEISKPSFLAGGLTPDNVKERIDTCHPYAVDVSSGVEGEDGWKDLCLIREFITKVRGEQL